MCFNDVWHSGDEQDWNSLLKKYWSLVPVANIQIEYQLTRLSKERVASMDASSWYRFLHDEYFVWKYTAKNRLATTRAHLNAMYKRSGGTEELEGVRKDIVNIDAGDIIGSLRSVCRIGGLRVAGASGLLSLVYPNNFATVDQFVVKALLEVQDHHADVRPMNPEGLTIKDGATLTRILRSKAATLNRAFGSRFWTPRTIEMALWAYRGDEPATKHRCS